MRILVHDYAGHPFQVQLSRSLAGRGHQVLHAYAAGLQTPRGALSPKYDDPSTFAISAVDIGEPITKTALLRRRRQEIRYGRLAAALVVRFDPDVVVSANTPLDAQKRLQQASRVLGARFVFWLQDVFGEGIRRVLRRKLPGVGWPIAWHYRALEQRLLERSDAVVMITEDFSGAIDPDRIDRSRLHVVPNWAPLDELPLKPRRNGWAREQGLEDKLTFLYAGTLGLKHNPALLERAAEQLGNHGNAEVVVISEGAGAEWLQRRKAERRLENLRVLGFQPFERLPEVLATADVLMAILEPDAGYFSVPSKVLTYLCAGRPLLVAVPPANLAARVVEKSGGGRVVDPCDEEAWVREALLLASDSKLRRALGENARAYAEATFDIASITDAFEDVFACPDGGKTGP
jgi:colanic acid biosynthesis glycosyl transferase WcaI